MKFKYAEWRKVEPQLEEGVDELIIHIEAMTGISDESKLIYKEVRKSKSGTNSRRKRYRQELMS